MSIDLVRLSSRDPESHTLTLCPVCTDGDAGLRIEGWESCHPGLASWPPEWLADQGRPWLVPIHPGPVAVDKPRSYEIREGSVLDAQPGWLAVVGIEIGGALIRTESRPLDHCWAWCLPELIAAIRERASIAWWGAGIQALSPGDSIVVTSGLVRGLPGPARPFGSADGG